MDLQHWREGVQKQWKWHRAGIVEQVKLLPSMMVVHIRGSQFWSWLLCSQYNFLTMNLRNQQAFGSQLSCGRPIQSSWLLASTWLCFSHCSYLESKPVKERALSLPLSLYLSSKQLSKENNSNLNILWFSIQVFWGAFKNYQCLKPSPHELKPVVANLSWRWEAPGMF